MPRSNGIELSWSPANELTQRCRPRLLPWGGTPDNKPRTNNMFGTDSHGELGR